MAAKEGIVIVRAYPRLHIGLLDLAGASLRRYGGAGFILDCMPIRVSAGPGRSALLGLDLLDSAGRRDVLAALDRMAKRFPIPRPRMTVQSLPPQHVGLGTKTAVVLALLKAWQVFSALHIESRQMQRLSGRGGASGVGIHGFFRGGFIADLGHKASEQTQFSPSSYRVDFDVPPIALRLPIPKDWRFALFLPHGRRYSGNQELRFFHSNTPIPRSQAKDAIATLYHGVVPAVIQQDIDLLRLALRDLHRSGFKHRELRGQAEPVQRLFKELERVQGCAVGLSSLGPLVYAVLPAAASDLLNDLCVRAARHGAEPMAICAGRNQGHEVMR
jgi:beta-ribofuranosylaminobenzene 5'-phosphate synthase